MFIKLLVQCLTVNARPNKISHYCSFNNVYHLLSAYFVPDIVLRVYLTLTPNPRGKHYRSSHFSDEESK